MSRSTFSIQSLICLVLVLLNCNCKKSTPDNSRLVPQIDSSQLTKHQFAEPHLGTIVRIVFYSNDQEQAHYLAKQCFDRLKQLNAMLSDYLPDSEVSKLSKLPQGKPHKISKELFNIIDFAKTISEKTQGAFDITIGKHSKRWRNKDLKPDQSSDTPADYRDLVLDRQNKTITLNKPLMIDLGAIGKGYIADELMLILKQANITQAAVIIGGETVLADAPPEKDGWHIGIEDPEHNVIGKVVLSNTCVSTSGDSYQFFEIDGKRQAHVIDPKTKQGKTNRLNVTTIAPSAMQADAWATALRVLPIEKAIITANKECYLEALFIPHQLKIRTSSNFPKLKNLSKAKKP